MFLHKPLYLRSCWKPSQPFWQAYADNGDSGYNENGFDESIALEVDDSIAKDNAFRLLDAIVSGNRMKILDAAMNMMAEDATRLRNQIRNQRAVSTPIDKAVIDAANFAVEIIECKESVITT